MSFDPRGLTLDMSFQTIALLMLSLFCKKCGPKIHSIFLLSSNWELCTHQMSIQVFTSSHPNCAKVCRTAWVGNNVGNLWRPRDQVGTGGGGWQISAGAVATQPHSSTFILYERVQSLNKEVQQLLAGHRSCDGAPCPRLLRLSPVVTSSSWYKHCYC